MSELEQTQKANTDIQSHVFIDDRRIEAEGHLPEGERELARQDRGLGLGLWKQWVREHMRTKNNDTYV